MNNITQKLSYGVYVVTSLKDGAPKGCIANCAIQITSEPATFAVSMNRDNYTHKCIRETGKFAVSVLAVDSDPDIIRTFGFKSGADIDKFAGVKYTTEHGLPVISDSCGYIVCEVIDTLETVSHTVFLARLLASGSYGDREAMTYDYYHKVIKGSSPKNAPTYVAPVIQPSEPEIAVEKPAAKPAKKEHEKKAKGGKRKFVCAICGYEYEGDELPEGFECPICGVGPEMFTEVK